MNKVTFYAVGVGPGDPELMTLKAIKTIEKCKVIAVPCSKKENSAAYQIIQKVCDLSGKEILEIDMPMTQDTDVMHKAHINSANIISQMLDAGKDTAFITLGDPAVYSTAMYILEILKQNSYHTLMVSSVSSVTAAAAALNISLGLGDEEIHIIPGCFESDMDDILSMQGTKVIMKIGRNLQAIKEKLSNYTGTIYIIENCGMVNEKIYHGIEELGEKLSYYSIIVLKN